MNSKKAKALRRYILESYADLLEEISYSEAKQVMRTREYTEIQTNPLKPGKTSYNNPGSLRGAYRALKKAESLLCAL